MNMLGMTLPEIVLAVLWAVFACGLGWVLAQSVLAVPLSPGASGVARQARRLPWMMRVLLPVAPSLAFWFRRPQFRSLCVQVEASLTAAGYEDTLNAQEYLALCLLVPLIWGGGAAVAVLGMFASAGQALGGRIIVLALALFLWAAFYPYFWLRNAVVLRHRAIMRALPFVMDLLTISVEAGLDFMTAIRNIIERRKTDALGEEFGRVLFEIQLGKTRREALRHMAGRIDHPDIHSLVMALTQADEMGVSIGATLRIQSDQIRVKRFLRAEKMAHEAPVKMLFPLIVFIFPAVFLVLLGPLALQVLRQGL